MSMEWMARSPGDVADSYYDKTLNLEGREELIDNIKEQYPDEYQKSEDEIEQDRLTEAIWDPSSPENQNLEEQGGTEFPTDTGMEAGELSGADFDSYNLEGFEGGENIFQPQTLNPEFDLSRFTEREIKGFKLEIPLDEREPELGAKLKSQNLEETLEAFREINADENLTAIFDHNGDGEFTLRDLLDLSRMNDGKGPTEAQDREMTDKFLNQLEGKDLAARFKMLWGQLPGSLRTAHLIDGRQSRFDPRTNKIYSQNFDNNLRAGILEDATNTLNIPEQAMHWMSGGRFGGAEGERFGDWLSNTKNPNSMAYLMMTPAKLHWADGVGHEVGYWGSSVLQITATLGWSGVAKGGAAALAKNASKGQRLAAATKKFLTPGLPIKGATNAAKLRSLGWHVTRSGYIETFKGAMTRDLNYASMVGIYNENKLAKRFIDAYPEGWIAGAQLHAAINSPLGKRLSYWIDEGAQDSVFGGAMYGIFNPLKGLRFGKSVYKNMRTGLSKHEWSANPLSQVNGRFFWKARQTKGVDSARAGTVQLDLFEPSNPFFREGDPSGRGAFKNVDGNDVAQGITEVRSGPRQILNDADEIQGQLFGGKRGTTDAILDPTDLAIAARHGVNGPIYEKLTKNLVEDASFAEQLKSLDPASRTVGGYGEGTLNRVKEIVQGRESLSAREFWGDALYDAPLKAGTLEELDEMQKFVAEKLFVADAVNSSLLAKLRDISAVAGEQIHKQDIFAVDGAMKRVADNLTAGLSNVKKTRLTWSMMADRLKESNGQMTKEMVDEVNSMVASRADGLHDETVDGVRLMMQMLKDSDSDELIEGLLDVFKVSNDIHNFKDFDSWMRQKITGGEFRGKVKTGALIHELQGVMVNSILSGPKTPLRAILGTTTNAYLNAINEYAGALIRSPFTDDVIARKASAAKLKGMVELLPEAWQVFKENWNAKFTADFANIRTRYSEAPTRGDHNWELFRTWTERNGTDGDKAALYLTNNARKLNDWKLASWSPRALAATDDTFKWLLARARSKEIGMRQALEAAGEDWAKYSPNLMKQAEDLHYRNLLDAEGNLDLSADSWLNKQFKEITLTSELNGFSKKLDGLLNETPLLKPFYLFARTGINGLNLSYKNTPLLGALHKESLDILRHTGDDFTPLMKYGIENANDLANAKNLFAGRQAVGATVVTGMGMMYQAGQLTGNGPADRQLKQQWINSGWKPNHIYIGNVGFAYSSLEPFNVIFSAIADIGDNIELMGSEWAEKRLQAVGFVLGRGLTSKTYMSGLDQLMQVVQMKPGAWNKTAANILNNSVPLAGLRNEFGKWINPHMKELNSDMWDSIRNRNQMSELVAGKNKLPIKHDILNGKPINNWNIIGRSFNAISPIQLDVRNTTPGRQLLLNSNYDLKATTYSYGGYSFAENARVRSHFQNTIGSVPIEFRGRKFKNLEAALNYVSTLPDVKTSMKTMKDNTNNPAKWDVNPNDYPHNTIINLLMDQARAKAYAAMNQPTHPGYADLQEVKSKKDGLNNRTRDTRQEILELNYPTSRQTNFPK